jgi:hypothetical protein
VQLVLVQLDGERASIERQQTAGFVRKEQSRPAHLLIVPRERPRRRPGPPPVATGLGGGLSRGALGALPARWQAPGIAKRSLSRVLWVLSVRPRGPERRAEGAGPRRFVPAGSGRAALRCAGIPMAAEPPPSPANCWTSRAPSRAPMPPDLRSPDSRDIAAGSGTFSAPKVTVVSVPPAPSAGGFDWGDAGLGAGAAFGVTSSRWEVRSRWCTAGTATQAVARPRRRGDERA